MFDYTTEIAEYTKQGVGIAKRRQLFARGFAN